MEIAIVAESSFQNQLDIFFKNFEKKNKIEFKKFFFNSDKNFLNNQKKLKFNLVFLVHSNKNPTIFNLAARIKENNQKCEIIFASYSSEFAVLGYKIGLSYYLLNPFSYEEFDFALKKILKNTSNSNKKSAYILINSGWQKIPIETSKIQFAEKIGHNVVIHTQEKTFSTRSTLTEFINNFKNMPNFIHCVRGAIVNLTWVKKLEPQNFLMKTGERISIRRKDRKKIKQIYSEFLIYNKNENENQP